MLREHVPQSARIWKRRRHQRRLFREWGAQETAERYVAEHGLTTTEGPFAGLRFPPEAIEWEQCASQLVAFLSGTYEREIHPHLQSHSGLFVDIGCAEGCYLVGMARRGCQSIGFEIDPARRRRALKLARLNEVDVAVRGQFTPDGLDLDGALVLCDIEGVETELIPQFAERFRRSRMIIEFHNGSEDVVIPAFQHSHAVTVIPYEYDLVRPNEYRPPEQTWGLFEPRG